MAFACDKFPLYTRGQSRMRTSMPLPPSLLSSTLRLHLVHMRDKQRSVICNGRFAVSCSPLGLMSSQLCTPPVKLGDRCRFCVSAKCPNLEQNVPHLAHLYVDHLQISPFQLLYQFALPSIPALIEILITWPLSQIVKLAIRLLLLSNFGTDARTE